MRQIITFLFCVILAIPAFALQHIPESISGYMDDDGSVLEDGYVAYYSSAALSTFKAVYSDYNGTTSVSQSGDGIQLNSSGQPTSGANEVVLFGSGNYWVVLKDSDGVTVSTFEAVVYSEPASPDQTPWINVADVYGTDDSDIQSLLTAYNGTDRVTFMFDDDFTISSSQTFTEYHRLWFVKGATLTVESGNTLTINSDEIVFENNSYISNSSGATVVFSTPNVTASEEYQVFQGAGTYTTTLANNIIHDEWFGGSSNFTVSRTGMVTTTGNYTDEQTLRTSRYTGGSIALAVAAATANSGVNYTLIVDRDFTLTAALTIPTNIKTIKFTPGSVLSGAYTITMTDQYIDAPQTQIIGLTTTLAGPVSNDELLLDWWGVVEGDSTASANNTTAIKAALTYAGSSITRNILQANAGTFYHGFIELDGLEYVDFRGSGRVSTRFENNDTTASANFQLDACSRMSFRDMAIRGEGKGLWIRGSNRTEISNCEFGNQGSGIVLQGSYDGGAQSSDHTHIKECNLRNNGETDSESNLEIRGPNMNNVYITNCQFGDDGLHGILADAGTHLTIENSEFAVINGVDSVGDEAIKIVQYEFVSITGCRFENFGTGVLVAPASGEHARTIDIAGCSFTSGEYGVRTNPVGSVFNISIRSSLFENFNDNASDRGISFAARTSFGFIHEDVVFRDMYEGIRGSADTTAASSLIDLSAGTPDLSDVVSNPADYILWLTTGTDYGYYVITGADDAADTVTINTTVSNTDTVQYEIYKYSNFVTLSGTPTYWYRLYPRPDQGLTIDASSLSGRLNIKDLFQANSNFKVDTDYIELAGERTTTPNSPDSGVRIWYDNSTDQLKIVNSNGDEAVVVDITP